MATFAVEETFAYFEKFYSKSQEDAAHLAEEVVSSYKEFLEVLRDFMSAVLGQYK